MAVAAHADWPPAPPLPAVEETDPGPLPPSVTAEPMTGGQWRCTFRYRPEQPIGACVLAGTFNDWSREAVRFKRPAEEGGEWVAQVTLSSGEYQYKFVVNGDTWLSDPRNPMGVPDGHQGTNSVMRLGRLASLAASDAKVGDGRIDALALEHRSGTPQYFQWLGRDRALLRYRTLAHDVDKVEAVIEGGDTVRMSPVRSDERFQWFEAEASIPPSRGSGPTRSIGYTFVLGDGPLRGADPQVYVASFAENLVVQVPEWARRAVWYQIMVDRFRNGNPDNDPDNVRPWTSEWFTPSPWETENGETFYRWFVFKRLYGGDIDGLEQKLPYLKELGVNALYLNPVFISPSHHKYDATNYLHIDPHYGVGAKDDYAAISASEGLLDAKTWKWTASDKRFLKFIRKAHEMGFKVVIDGVFNHVGVPHPAFQDVMKNGQKSRFADWFDVTSWEPFKYNGWAGHDSLPVFKKSQTGLASPSLTRHIYDVTARWLAPDGDPNNGVDGWRLDVPNELPREFWVGWREHVRKTKPDAYITGEIWDQADQWLDGRTFDAVMNYPFARTAVAWLFDREHKIKASEADRRLATLRMAYPAPVTYALMNLMGSHDTDRVASMAQNPDRAYDARNRVQDDNPAYDNSKPSAEAYRRALLAALLQMTYVGAPMIYYGDEVGMWGADDPTCRKPMLWEDLQPYAKSEENAVRTDLLAAYRRLVALRREHPALQTGSFETLLTDDASDVWAFMRSAAGDTVIVAINASGQPRTVQVPTPSTMTDVVPLWKDDGAQIGRVESGQLRLTIPPLSGVVLGHK